MPDDRFERNDLLKELKRRFEERMWANVTAREGTEGFERGTPSFETAKKIHRWYVKNGEFGKARAVEGVAVQAIWNGTKEMQGAGRSRKCKRCEGGHDETRKRRFYQCKGNAGIEDADVKETQYLCEVANGEAWDRCGAC